MNTSQALQARGPGFDDGAADVGLVGPVLVSGFALLLALMLGSSADAPPALRYTIVGLQAVMLAVSAAMSASSACVRIGQWAARAAPSWANTRTRHRLWRQLAITGTLGLAGPVLLAGRWMAADGVVAAAPAAMLATLAMLASAQALGACCGLAWRGRLPRWALLGWLLLVLAVSMTGPLLHGLTVWPLLALALLAGLAALWWWVAGLLRRPLLAWSGVPRFRGAAASGGRGKAIGWRLLPFADLLHSGRDGNVWVHAGSRAASSVGIMGAVFGSQAIGQPKLWVFLAWGQTVDGFGVLGYAGWLMALGIFCGTGLVHPGLHWRNRLAPGGLSSTGWAWRMLAGSGMASGALVVVFALLAVALAPQHQRGAMLSGCPLVLGDLALVLAFSAWIRGLRNHQVAMLLGWLAFAGVAAAVLAALAAMGWPLVRGGAWLAAELVLAAGLARAAVARWARRDLNPLAEQDDAVLA